METKSLCQLMQNQMKEEYLSSSSSLLGQLVDFLFSFAYYIEYIETHLFSINILFVGRISKSESFSLSLSL